LFFGVLQGTKGPQIGKCDINLGAIFGIFFFKLQKKLGKVYNSHECLNYKFLVIWSQNAKVLAKKQISTLCVAQNNIGVSCNHPSKLYYEIKIEKCS